MALSVGTAYQRATDALGSAQATAGANGTGAVDYPVSNGLVLVSRTDCTDPRRHSGCATYDYTDSLALGVGTHVFCCHPQLAVECRPWGCAPSNYSWDVTASGQLILIVSGAFSATIVGPDWSHGPELVYQPPPAPAEQAACDATWIKAEGNLNCSITLWGDEYGEHLRAASAEECCEAAASADTTNPVTAWQFGAGTCTLIRTKLLQTKERGHTLPAGQLATRRSIVGPYF